MQSLHAPQCGLQVPLRPFRALVPAGRLQQAACSRVSRNRVSLQPHSARSSVRTAAAEVSPSTAAGAAAGAEGFQEAIFPKLTNGSEEQEWVTNAVQVWLDQEWTPMEAHRTLGQAAGRAYVTARNSGKDEAGDVLLALTDQLSKANFKDTFVDQFGVSNKVIELLMLRHNMDVSCYRNKDRDQFKQIEKEVSSS